MSILRRFLNTILNQKELDESYENNSYEDDSCEDYANSRDEMIQEAVFRMKSIKMNTNIIADYEDSKIPQIYEPPYGTSYYLEEDEEEMVSRMEKQYHVLVWGIIRCFMSYNRKETTVDCMLTVSNNKKDWKQEREDLLGLNPFVYTYMKEHSIRDHGYINIYISEGGTPLRLFH